MQEPLLGGEVQHKKRTKVGKGLVAVSAPVSHLGEPPNGSSCAAPFQHKLGQKRPHKASQLPHGRAHDEVDGGRRTNISL